MRESFNLQPWSNKTFHLCPVFWLWLLLPGMKLTFPVNTVCVLQTKKYADVIIPRGVDNMGKRELGSPISLGRHLWGWEESRRHAAALSACS